MLCILDQFTREALAINVGRRIVAKHVLDCMATLFEAGSVPQYVRADQGPYIFVKQLGPQIATLGAPSAYMEEDYAWENACDCI